MNSFESLEPYIPVIDDRSEEILVRQAQAVAQAVSGGRLSDFSDSNPLGVLIRSQAFAGAELLYRINKLPLALAVQFLSNAGVERRLGAPARVSLTFTLTAPLTTSFTIPAQFEVVNSDAAASFLTDAALVIPPGSTQGVVSATSSRPGSEYNLPAFTINQVTVPLAFLAGVVNTEAAQGGADEESLEDTIARGVVSLRTRNPVSADDYRVISEQILGPGTRAKAVGLLGPDGVTRQIGAVHVFLLDSQGVGVNLAQRQAVDAAIRPRVMLGTSLYVSPMPTEDIRVEVVGKIGTLTTGEEATDALWQAMLAYFSPSAYEPGDSVQLEELRYQFRLVEGIERIEFVTINGGVTDVPMPTEFTAPFPYSLVCRLSNQDGLVTELARGEGESGEFVT